MIFAVSLLLSPLLGVGFVHFSKKDVFSIRKVKK